MDEQGRTHRFSTLQFFIPSHTKKRYSLRSRVYRGMPLAGGRNTAASNIGNIDRQTSFRAVQRLDNSRRKYRGNGEGLIKKYLQSSIITRRTRRSARAEGRERGIRTGDEKAPVRSCQVCHSSVPMSCLFLSFAYSSFSPFSLLPSTPSTDDPLSSGGMSAVNK